MDLPTSKFLQTFHLFTHLPPELQLNIWQYEISSSPARIAQITNLQTLRYSKPTTKLPSPAPVPSPAPRRFMSLLLLPLSRSQRWQLPFSFSTAGGGANTQSHPPASILNDFPRGGDIFWLERPPFYSLSEAQHLDSADSSRGKKDNDLHCGVECHGLQRLTRPWGGNTQSFYLSMGL